MLHQTRQHLKILDRLEIRPSDELVVRIVERCLPPATSSRWQDKLDMNKLPTLEDLLQFIQKTIFKLQEIDSESDARTGNNTRKRAGETIPQSQTKNSKMNVRSLVTTSASSSTSYNSSVCPKCHEEHRLFKCPAFNKLAIQERWDFVKNNKICRNCLWTHQIPFKSEKRCKKCNKNHHTLLHNEKGSDSQSSKNHETKPKPKDGNSSSTDAKA